MKKFFKTALYLLCFLFILSCDTDFSSDYSYTKAVSELETSASEEQEEGEAETIETCDEEVEEEEEINRDWTILVYMAADNNLESDAITDFNELEQVDFDESVTVLVLFDRSENYDSTNGDWSDTRLYKICKDEQKNKTLIASEQIDCDELGLKVGESCELDMSNPSTLEGFLEFSRRCYAAEQYALIIWGHGTGWRNSESLAVCETENARAFAIDDTSSSYMTISALRSAISSGMGTEKLAVIGFDTCFGMCVETAYELKDCAAFMLGTPALVPESGWNYAAFLSDFMKSEKSIDSFIESAASQYAESYQNYSYGYFSCVDLSKISDAVGKFSEFSQSLADSIDTNTVSAEISAIITEKSLSYCASSYPTDFYVDISDMLSNFAALGIDEAENVKNYFDDSIVCDWSASGARVSLGVFFCVYISSAVMSASHPSMYVNGSRNTGISLFVTDCTGYVPSYQQKNGSLLDKLFYTNGNL